jgi:hypothetical protein
MQTGGVAQVVEYLPSEHEALRSNSSSGRKKKKFVDATILLDSSSFKIKILILNFLSWI